MLSFTIFFWLLAAIFSFGALCFLLCTGYILYVHNKYAHLPSPKLPSFYCGHIPDILRFRRESGNPNLPMVDMCEKWMKEAGSDTIVVYFFYKARIFTTDTDLVKKIVTNGRINKKTEEFLDSIKKMYGQRFLGKALVVLPDYDVWLQRRKVLDPAFAKGSMEALATKFNPIIDRHLDQLKPLADGKIEIHLDLILWKFVLSIVSEVLFGESLEVFCKSTAKRFQIPSRSKSKYDEPLLYIFDKLNDGISKSLTSLTPSLLQYLDPVDAREFRNCLKALREVLKEQIEKRIRDIQEGKDTPNDGLEKILQLASIDGIEMDELTDNAFGFDTTVHMMEFTIALLAQHPEEMNRVLEEINDILEDKDGIDFEDVKKLTYLEQVLNESLRLYPIVMGTANCLRADVMTKDGKVVPTGITVLMMSSVMSRKAEIFENPEQFNPDRFAPATKPNSYEFFPFGIGPRSCIGKHFAMVEVKMFLVKFYQTYKVSLPEDFKITVVQEGFTHQLSRQLTCTLTPVLDL